MITLIFGFASDKVLITIDGNTVKFGSTSFGAVMANIEGLQLNYEGVCREHPDLELDEDWRKKAAERFKEKIKSYNTEEDRAYYIIEDLKNHGYIPEQMQRKGHRPVKIN